MVARKTAAFEPFGSAEKQAPPQRMCEAPGCACAGEYKAPRNRGLMEYMWLCLDHVRDYNKRWNYYEGMSQDEVEAEIRRDTCWQKPSWKLGTLGARGRSGPEINDPFGMMDDEAEEERRRAWRKERWDAKQRAGVNETHEEKALRVMDLTPPLSKEALKSRYKALVKIHHPDVNKGDKDAEERLKDINLAYKTLLGGLNA